MRARLPPARRRGGAPRGSVQGARLEADRPVQHWVRLARGRARGALARRDFVQGHEGWRASHEIAPRSRSPGEDFARRAAASIAPE
eukprot:7736562-Pyramimonas_sp.AAC.1